MASRDNAKTKAETEAKPITSQLLYASLASEISFDGFCNPAYIPKDIQDSFKDKTRIENTFQAEFEPKKVPNALMGTLVDYGYHNQSVFMTLAFKKLIVKIKPLSDGGFHDKSLPIGKRPDKEDNSRTCVYSLACPQKELGGFPQTENGADHHKDEIETIWDREEVDRFEGGQWAFQAPVFELGPLPDRLLNLSRDCPLPYVWQSKWKTAAASGNFGQVWRMGLRTEHLKNSSGQKYKHLRTVRSFHFAHTACQLKLG